MMSTFLDYIFIMIEFILYRVQDVLHDNDCDTERTKQPEQSFSKNNRTKTASHESIDRKQRRSQIMQIEYFNW